MTYLVSFSQTDSLDSTYWISAGWRPDVSFTLGFAAANVEPAGLPTYMLPSNHRMLLQTVTMQLLQGYALGPSSAYREQPTIPRPQTRSMRAAALLKQWLEDSSGYDERVWPQVRRAIEEHRLSHRKRFGE